MRRHRLAVHDPRRIPIETRIKRLGYAAILVLALLVLGYAVLIATDTLYALYKPLRSLERAAQVAGQAAEEAKKYRLEVQKREAEREAHAAELAREREENKKLTEQIKALSRAHAAEIRAVKRTEK